jgi:hypothetical protein
LLYLRARYYLPQAGIFTSRDPFPGFTTLPVTLQPYLYAAGNPLRYTDPSGKIIPFLAAAGLGALIGGGIDLGTQLLAMHPQSLSQALRCVNWGEVGIAFAGGAVAGLTGFTIFGATTALLGSGFFANVAAGTISDAVAGQYARLTGLVLSGQMSQIGKVLFQPQDMLLDSVLGGAFAGVGYGVGRLASASSATGDLTSVGTPCSFSEDTPVATGDGEKPIGEIQVGDEVQAYDEQNQTSAYYPVTAKFAHLDTDLVTLTIDGEKIETTPEHPFFTLERGWTPAGKLWIGAHILRSDGTSGEIERIGYKQSKEVMFNLTVDQAHTFFVGNEQWLVHNTCRWSGGSGYTNDPIGNNLVRDARAYAGSIPRTLENVTIAVSDVEGTKYVAINNTASEDAIQMIKQIAQKRGATFIISSQPGQAGHAERALYQELLNNKDLKIGVSKSPCELGPEPCSSFFSEVGFRGLFWPK